MNSTDIAFEKLGIYLRNVPKSFNVFGLRIALYGVVISVGMLLGLLCAVKVAKKSGQDPDTYWDLSIWTIVLSVLGARLYYVIFSWDSYKDDLLQILNIRNGGLAIYGGVLTAIVTLFVFGKIKKKNPFLLMDTAFCGLVLGQVIGRWGNFFNRECFGEYSNGLLSMSLPIEAVRANEITETMWEHVAKTGANYITVHPTFLYESLWNLGLLILMLIYFKHKKFDGEVALLYLAGYGVGRAIIESLRTDQLLIGNTGIPVSLALSLVMIALSVITDVVVRIRMGKNKKNTINETVAK
ncbi:MAG: prolipoprotein diacylglyceryl transferase [Lachnospiraceae bacterium]|nr:prolipoprotein diacylglyceryl transferase [Lachnospiraceae bacterium]